jgi:hypothetical protein
MRQTRQQRIATLNKLLVKIGHRTHLRWKNTRRVKNSAASCDDGDSRHSPQRAFRTVDRELVRLCDHGRIQHLGRVTQPMLTELLDATVDLAQGCLFPTTGRTQRQMMRRPER